jgi:hypothetical protein
MNDQCTAYHRNEDNTAKNSAWRRYDQIESRVQDEREAGLQKKPSNSRCGGENYIPGLENEETKVDGHNNQDEPQKCAEQ